MANPSKDDLTVRENASYLYIGRHLHAKKVPVPIIHEYDLKRGWFIMEDMGKMNLQEAALLAQDPLPVYEMALARLFFFQTQGAMGFNPQWCYQTQVYDMTVMRQYESDYFKEAFLRLYLGMDREWSELIPAFDHLAQRASRMESCFLLHRDFQSRNIMISPQGKIGIIDWQGARLGPLGYDLASLLIDPYSTLSTEHRTSLFHSYLGLIQGHNPAWVDPFKTYFPYLAIQRNLQILGAFAFLTRVKKKTQFESYIAPALRSLQELLGHIKDPQLSSLREAVDDIQPAPS
jgi:N-acetylmuramate 1-kinase